MEFYYHQAGKFTFTKTALINLDSVFLKDEWKKPEVPEILKLKEMNLIFWITRTKYAPEKCPVIQMKIKKLSKAFVVFGFYSSTPLYAPPFPHHLMFYVPPGEVTVAGNGIGSCSAFVDGKYIDIDTPQIDFMLHLNIPGSKFVYGDSFSRNVSAEVYPRISFDPRLYFCNKFEIFPKYHYVISHLKVNNKEILYIAGPPHFGKTLFAKNLAERWGYKYTDNNKNISKKRSTVVDNNPVCDHDYISADIRIFVLGEHELSELKEKMISTHLTLHFKKKHNMTLNTKEVKKYYSSIHRYPAHVKIEPIIFIPYQLYDGSKDLTLHYSKKTKDK